MSVRRRGGDMENTEETHVERFARWLRLKKSGDLMYMDECGCGAFKGGSCDGHIWVYPGKGEPVYWPDPVWMAVDNG